MLYQWKYSIVEFIEVLLVIVFSNGQRRKQIIYELVTEKNPLLINQMFQSNQEDEVSDDGRIAPPKNLVSSDK